MKQLLIKEEEEEKKKHFPKELTEIAATNKSLVYPYFRHIAKEQAVNNVVIDLSEMN
jgi:hypothetical protein